MQTRLRIACLSLALIAISPLFAQPSGQRDFGRGAPFTLEELPKGQLKDKVKKLKPKARAEAIKRLHSFSFPESDAEKFLRVDDNGGVFIVCPIEGCGHDCKAGDHGHGDAESTLEGEGTVAAQTGNATAENIPIGDGTNETFNPSSSVPVSAPPVFNSKPGAPFHIYLDFNGAYVTGKAWTYNDGTTTFSTWDCQAWSTDSDRATFSVSEQNDIRRMWERIAEDYAPFNVNVTTDAAFDPDNYTGDKNKVGWLLTTPTTDKNGVRCPHYGYGGVAYVNVFGRSDFFSRYQPAWVTPMGTANTAEAASHEMGHNMGLSHDGLTTGAAYYGGHAGTSSAPSWGPIMGTGYGRNVSQWSKTSEYYNGNQAQDDLTIIAGKVSYQADDHGDTFQTATAWAQSPVNQPGIVENTGDPDVFTFTTGSGTVSFSANTYRCDTQTWGANLDAVLELYDSTQTLVASSNPLADTNASISTSVPAGTYYLVLTPTGTGSPLNSPPSGYTAYGSLGYYSITGAYSPADSIFVTAPNGGESWLGGTPNEITWTSGIGGNVSIQLLKGGSVHSTISSSTPNDGSFVWNIPSAQALGNDYKIRVASLSNPSVTAESVSNFSIVADLLASALDTTGYTWTTSGNANWFPQSAVASDGTDAAQSGLITHNQNSSVFTTLTGPGTLTFSWKVSSEGNYDFLRFFLNGVEQTGTLARISGEVDWVQKSVAIPAGTSTVEWRYTKDGSVDTGADAAWLDQVSFLPPSTPGSLAVTPAGNLSASGNYGGTFTPSSLGYTLENTGGESINWTAAKTQNWVTLSSTSGTLAAGASTTVTVSINTGASSLNAGSYSDTVTFTNTTNADGNAARPVSLMVNPAPSTVTLGNLNQTYDGSPKQVSVITSPAGLAHTVTYNGSVTIPTNAGTYSVVATITAPNRTGSASGSLIINKASQTINFGSLASVTEESAPFGLAATASSGLPVSYTSSNPSVASVSANTVTPLAVGTTTITATQGGDANYNAATSVAQTLNVTADGQIATGGEVEFVDGYYVHTFAQDGTFELLGETPVNVEVLVVGGGGGGGSSTAFGMAGAGGGGAGGLVYLQDFEVAGSQSVVIGTPGAAAGTGNRPGGNGGDSVFGSLVAIGGGGGSGGNMQGLAGGSGGGSRGNLSGGAGQQPGSASEGFGNPGGGWTSAGGDGAGGGGGAGEAAVSSSAFNPKAGGPGGNGLEFDISGTSVFYAGGGGGGGANTSAFGTGGQGGGGNGANNGSPATPGAANTGAGGGGGNNNRTGANGGSGVVIVRYPGTAPNNPPVVDAGPDQTVSLGGGAGAWDLTSLSPSLWLDADDTSTIAVNGSGVSQWNDKSGNDRHATQGSAASQPVQIGGGLNGRSVLSFDGSNDSLNVDLDFMAGVDHSVFVVTKTTAYSNIYGAANGSSGANSLHVGFRNSTSYRMNYWANDWYGTISSNFRAGEANLMNYVWLTGTRKEVFANGASEGSTGSAGVIGTMSGGGRIGAVVGQGFYGGDVAEFIAFSGPVSLEDRQAIEGYLAHKWGLQANLPAGHPFETTAPGGSSGAVVDLDGTVTDPDGDTFTSQWSVVSGPSSVTFGDATAEDTTVTFTASGTYVLELTADDGTDQASDQVTITVEEAGDTTAPTLASGDIADDRGGANVTENGLVTYTLTFSEDMDETSVDASDFSNAGSSLVSIGAVTEISPGAFTVEATPTTAGTLRLQVSAGALLTDLAGNALDTTTAIADDTIIIVETPLATVPDVLGLAQAGAESAITAADLTVGTVSGEYSETVPEGNVISQGLAAGSTVPQGSSVDLVVSLGIDASPKLVRMTVSSVSSMGWTNVSLGKSYNSPVIIATPIYPPGVTVPLATRITNVTPTGFDLKLDRADGLTDAMSLDVSVVVVDEGVYTQAEHGVTMEAVKFLSTVTARNTSWVAEARSFQNTYTSPVVVGQVMSANDSNWSAFWSMGSSRTNPVNASNLNVGKHVGEDPNTTRADETIGYIVIESGTGVIDGVAFEAALGAKSVRGLGNSASPYTYSLSGNLDSASAAAASMSGMSGTDGAWAVLSGSSAFSSNSIGLHACEDKLKDSEQSHAPEHVGYIVFE